MTIRTVEEAFAAGMRDAQDDPPLSVEQVTAIALLLAPYRKHQDADREYQPPSRPRPDDREDN